MRLILVLVLSHYLCSISAEFMHIRTVTVLAGYLSQEKFAIFSPTEGCSNEAAVSYKLIKRQNSNGSLVWLIESDIGRMADSLI